VGQAALEEPVGRAQAVDAGAAFGVVAENAHVDASMTKIGAGLDAGHCHEPYPRVLEILRDRIGDDGSHRLIDAPHAATAHPTLRTFVRAATSCIILANPRRTPPGAPRSRPRGTGRGPSAPPRRR